MILALAGVSVAVPPAVWAADTTPNYRYEDTGKSDDAEGIPDDDGDTHDDIMQRICDAVYATCTNLCDAAYGLVIPIGGGRTMQVIDLDSEDYQQCMDKCQFALFACLNQ